ncbi:MAG: holo-ACP synthase [Clostridia bacterium]|nr:holo-ACP synthase [Clostridia bacterium]
MKVSCGTDITEITRIKDAIEREGQKFITEIYTENEIKYCESKKNAKYQHYAARFAAKEAIYKAISSFLDNKFEVSWKNAEILNTDSGKPYVVFHDVNFEERIVNIDISLSHSKENAIANVTILYN